MVHEHAQQQEWPQSVLKPSYTNVQVGFARNDTDAQGQLMNRGGMMQLDIRATFCPVLGTEEVYYPLASASGNVPCLFNRLDR